jgi:hypothetical protein
MTNFTVHRNKRYRATIRLGLLEPETTPSPTRCPKRASPT